MALVSSPWLLRSDSPSPRSWEEDMLQMTGTLLLSLLAWASAARPANTQSSPATKSHLRVMSAQNSRFSENLSNREPKSRKIRLLDQSHTAGD